MQRLSREEGLRAVPRTHSLLDMTVGARSGSDYGGGHWHLAPGSERERQLSASLHRTLSSPGEGSPCKTTVLCPLLAPWAPAMSQARALS